MPFTLDQILPWGRSFDEYVAVFALTADDLDMQCPQRARLPLVD